MRDRAAALWARLVARGVAPAAGARAPWHAGAPDVSATSPALHRAAWNTRLVLEDPAAGVHNAPFARALMDEAEPLLATPTPTPTSSP